MTTVRDSERKRPVRQRRVRTPTVLQMEAVECGAASLGIVLAHYGRRVPLEELRVACGVSRDGALASNVLRAARHYGLKADGFQCEVEGLKLLQLPAIIHWNFNHYLVLEGFRGQRVYLNDPARGPRTVSLHEFDESFTGIALAFEPEENFVRAGQRHGLIRALGRRLVGTRFALIYVVLASLALIIPGLIIPAFVRVFIDDILIGGQRDWLRPLLLVMLLTAAVRAVLTWIQQRSLLRLETRIALSSSSKVFWHTLRLPIEFFTQRYGGEIGSRIAINDRVAQILSEELATTMINIVLIVFYAALMFYYNPLLTLVGIAIAILNYLALQYVSRRRVDTNQRLLQERGKLLGAAMNGLQTIETLKATGVESDFFAQWAGYQAKTLNAQQQLGLSSQVLAVVPPFLSAISTVAILTIGGLQVMQGQLSLGLLVAFQSLMMSFLEPVNQMVNLGSRLQEVSGDLARLDDVLHYQTDDQLEGIDIAAQVQGTAKLTGEVELRQVTFGYNPLGKPLIEDFNLHLKPGARVALVGGSGSGKSTIARIMAGLYRPWKGEVLFDGQPRAEIPRYLIHNSLALVDQDIFLFEGSVHDNVTLWDHTVPEHSILEAAKDAYIHEDIVERSGGYDHLVEEGGRNFSGGQRQRLEIARALVGNPTILILDEATSALDALTEKIIDDQLRQRGCTCLIVAHRLSTIRDCDEIIVLERGKVVQRGTHEELRHVDGPYLNLVTTEVSEMDTITSAKVPS